MHCYTMHQSLIFDLPGEVLAIICDMMLDHKDRVMLSMCCHSLKSLHQHRCARHASFQRLREAMRKHVFDKYSRQHREGGCIVAYILNPSLFCRWLYNFIDDEYWFETIKYPVMFRTLMQYDSLCYYAIHINGAEATVATHPKRHGDDTHPIVMLSGTYGVPKPAWDLYVSERGHT